MKIEMISRWQECVATIFIVAKIFVEIFYHFASYLDIYFEHDINGTLTTKLYDKCDHFNFLSPTIRFSIVSYRRLLHIVFKKKVSK